MSTTILILFFLSFGIGYAALSALWFSKYAFGPAWLRLSGITKEQMCGSGKKAKMLTFAITALFAIGTGFVFHYIFLLASYFLIGFVWYAAPVTAIIVWLAFVALPAASQELYAPRSWKLFFINNGFALAYFLLLAVIWFIWLSNMPA